MPNHPPLGAFCRTLPDVGWRRRPLLRLVTAGSGGPGQPSAGITTGCLQWLDAAGTKAGGSPPDQGRRRAIPFPPGSYGAGDEKAAWWSAGRRRASRRPRGAPRRSSDRSGGGRPWLRRSALHPLALFHKVRGSTPPRPLKCGGAFAKSGAVRRAETVTHIRRIRRCQELSARRYPVAVVPARQHRVYPMLATFSAQVGGGRLAMGTQ